MKYIIAIAAIALVVCVLPFVVILSLNTLFATGIPFTIETFGAVLVLLGVAAGVTQGSK